MRYIVIKPQPDDYWRVCDTEHPEFPGLPVLTIHKSVPNSGKVSYDLADKLNQEYS